jgi:transcriptional regulator with XRE-family HTH domain
VASPDPRAQLGKTVRQKRLSLGLSQEALAERANLHWTYIGGIERGERNVSLINIVKIARALEVPPARLMAGIQ